MWTRRSSRAKVTVRLIATMLVSMGALMAPAWAESGHRGKPRPAGGAGQPGHAGGSGKADGSGKPGKIGGPAGGGKPVERRDPTSLPTVGTHVTDAAHSPAPVISRSPMLGKRPAITCVPFVQRPQPSAQVGGRVNVLVALTCTAPVPVIIVQAVLLRNGEPVAASRPKHGSLTPFAGSSASAPCQTGIYQGFIQFFVRFPPGFAPPTGVGAGRGPFRFIRC